MSPWRAWVAAACAEFSAALLLLALAMWFRPARRRALRGWAGVLVLVGALSLATGLLAPH